jgi:uncharacterized protein (TIGR02466 family)
MLHEIINNPVTDGYMPKTEYCNVFTESLQSIVDREMVESNYKWKYSKLLWGRVARMGQNEWDPPHVHLGPMLVGVFYLQIQKGHGDLYLVPNGSNSGFSTHDDPKRGTRIYHKVTPTEGKLVLFPGDLIHFVTHNTSTLPRYSIALNIEMKPIKT